jgi:hypothetical protein
MLSEIRVAFVSIIFPVGVSSAALIVQNFGSQPPPALDNEYVKVTVSPPSTNRRDTMSLCFNGDIPLVQVYIPSRQSAANEPPNPERVSAMYVEARAAFGCSSALTGTFIFIDLKSVPSKSNFDDDAIKLDASHNEVLFENDHIRVVRVHFDPGESGPIVDKRPRVIFAVTASHAVVTFPDGHNEPREMKAGTVSFGNAGRQATKNTGTTPLENIVVELKSKDSGKK